MEVETSLVVDRAVAMIAPAIVQIQFHVMPDLVLCGPSGVISLHARSHVVMVSKSEVELVPVVFTDGLHGSPQVFKRDFDRLVAEASACPEFDGSVALVSDIMVVAICRIPGHLVH